MEDNQYGKFSNFEIISVRDLYGESKPDEYQIAELHAVPDIIVTGHLQKDVLHEFSAKTIVGRITIITSDDQLAEALHCAISDHVAINLFEIAKDVKERPIDIGSTILEKFNFGIVLNNDQLARLKHRPEAKVLEAHRFETYQSMFGISFEIETSIGKYTAIVNDKVIGIKLAASLVTGESVNLFEKIENQKEIK